jgi:PAS domain-containing protein
MTAPPINGHGPPDCAGGDEPTTAAAPSPAASEHHRQENDVRRLSDALGIVNVALRRASTAAAANRARYLALVDHLPDTGAYVWDRAHRISDASGAGIASRGFVAADLLGLTPDEIMTPTDATRVHGYLDAAFHGQPVREEVRFETTGILNRVDVLAVMPPPHSTAAADGGPDEVLFLAQDVGALRQRERALAAAEARWRAAFDGAPVGMAEMDIEGRILRCNQALLEIMRLPPRRAPRPTSLRPLSSRRAERRPCAYGHDRQRRAVERGQRAAPGPGRQRRAALDQQPRHPAARDRRRP